MPELSDDKFMLLYNEIKAVGKELSELKDQRIHDMLNDLSNLKVKMAIVFSLLGLVTAGFVTYLFTTWERLTAPH